LTIEPHSISGWEF